MRDPCTATGSLWTCPPTPRLPTPSSPDPVNPPPSLPPCKRSMKQHKRLVGRYSSPHVGGLYPAARSSHRLLPFCICQRCGAWCVCSVADDGPRRRIDRTADASICICQCAPPTLPPEVSQPWSERRADTPRMGWRPYGTEGRLVTKWSSGAARLERPHVRRPHVAACHQSICGIHRPHARASGGARDGGVTTIDYHEDVWVGHARGGEDGGEHGLRGHAGDALLLPHARLRRDVRHIGQ